MARKQAPVPTPPEPKEFTTADEIDAGISKLERRLKEVNDLNIRDAHLGDTGADTVAINNVRSSILEVFGPASPEYSSYKSLRFWAGGMFVNMSDEAIIEHMERGRVHVIGVLNGLVTKLREKREDLTRGSTPQPKTYFDSLNLHSRISDVARDLFLDGYPWEAVFAASKALVNYVKERSGRHDLDGASLMRTIFSRNGPVLAFNDLKDQTDADEQEGMMHLFEGVVLGIRNPGGHSFPEGTEQRAIEYISLLSLLAYRVQESKRFKTP